LFRQGRLGNLGFSTGKHQQILRVVLRPNLCALAIVAALLLT
jgi:hypothetical protein